MTSSDSSKISTSEKSTQDSTMNETHDLTHSVEQNSNNSVSEQSVMNLQQEVVGSGREAELETMGDGEMGEDQVFSVNIETPTGTILKLQISNLDAIIEIKQLLVETLETCYITQYELCMGDTVLQEYSDIAGYESIVPDCTITMKTTQYDTKAIKQHVHRFKDLLYARLDNLYLSKGSVETLSSKNEISFPSFSQPDTEDETTELASALDCDKAFEQYNAALNVLQEEQTQAEPQKQQKQQQQQQQQQQAQGRSSRKNRQRRKKEKRKQEEAAATSGAATVQTEEELIDELVAEIEGAGKKGGKKKKKGKQQESEAAKDDGESGNKDASRDLQPFNSLHLCNNKSLEPMTKWLSLTSAKPPKCIKSISFSGFNPPPGNRALNGDLLYLRVVTMEEKILHITAKSNGFFVNRSTDNRFDPRPARNALHSHTLVGVVWNASPIFKKTFAALLDARVRRHPFEATPIPFSTEPWLVPSHEHEYDENRAEQSFSVSLAGDLSRNRDFNEELKACRELPSGTMEERIIRDRTLFKIHCEFYESAVKGAKMVVDNALYPLNPMDPLPAQVFIHDNIFFSVAFDERKIMDPLSATEYEVDPVVYASTNNEMHGVRALNDADVRGVYPLASAIVDYKGYRILAHSVIPGILHGDEGTKHVYGSIDNGETYNWDEKYHKLLEEAAAKMHIKPHPVLDESGKEYIMATPAECKGLLGSDGRFYVLDLLRSTPRDANYPDDNTAILRRELIDAWVERLRQKDLETKMAQRASDATENQADAQQTEDTLIDAMSEQTEEEFKQTIRFNPDVLIKEDGKQKFLPDNEELEDDKRAVEELATFLKKEVIPRFVQSLPVAENMIPIDGCALTEAMHENGINMRYLGEVATLAEKFNIPYIVTLAQEEMVARAAKWEFRKLLVACKPNSVAKMITAFLNNLLSPLAAEQKQVSSDYSITKDNIVITRDGLVQRLIESIKQKYRYDLSKDFFSTLRNPFSLLRSVSLKVGLRVNCRDYNFAEPNPITVDDIQGLEPVVKHSVPTSMTAQKLFEAGRRQIFMGQLESGYEFLSQAIVMFQQIRGPMNAEVAQICSLLSAILHSASELPQAIIHQFKALIISRRLYGIDSSAVCHLHQVLGLLCSAISQNKFALKHFLRARYISRLISANGDNHPEIATISSNIGMMYQYLGDIPRSMRYLEEGLRINRNTMGEDSMPTASSYHAIAIVYSLLGDNRRALKCEQQSYKILSKILPKESPESQQLLQESQRWMTQFTTKAVEQQKRANEMQKQQQLEDVRQLLRESPYFTAMNKLSNKLGGSEEFLKWMQELQQQQEENGGEATSGALAELIKAMRAAGLPTEGSDGGSGSNSRPASKQKTSKRARQKKKDKAAASSSKAQDSSKK